MTASTFTRFATAAALVAVAASPASATETPEAAVERGVGLIKAGKKPDGHNVLQAALKRLQADIAANPKNADKHHAMGRALFYLARDADAHAAFQQAAKLAPKQPEHPYMAGVTARYLRRPADAIKALKAAVALAPDNARYQYELGDVYYNNKQAKEALRHLELAAKADPKHARALFKAGVLHLEAKRDDKAVALWRRAAAADPRYANPLYNIGQVFQNAGKQKEALAQFQRVLVLAPDDWRARSKVIQLHQALGQIKQRDAARKALLAQYKGGKDAKLKASKWFCREQFTAHGRKVMVMEHFELVGEMAQRYSFLVLDAAGAYDFKVTLGSYEKTNKISRELGKLKKGQRLWHMDGYFKGGVHRTYRFFNSEPPYEATRKAVVAVLADPTKAQSSTTP